MGGGYITGRKQARYRLRLARGFLEEARQDAELERWRSVVDGAQLAVENAGKTVLALAGSIGRTPWELFTEADARQALAVAEEAVTLADQTLREGSRGQ